MYITCFACFWVVSMEVGSTPTKTFSRVCSTPNDLCICIQCGDEVNNVDKRRKLFNGLRKTPACENLERLVGVCISQDTCLSNTVCRCCTDKNTTLVKKIEFVRELFKSTEDAIKENHCETVTKRQRSEGNEVRESSNNPVKRRVSFPIHDHISNTKDGTTQTDVVSEPTEVSSVSVS